MSLEICIHCIGYQHRLNWMLNSIEQQIGNIPELLVNISYLEREGNPTTENIISFFEDRKKIKFKHTSFLTKKLAENRGIARNEQLKTCESEWVLFADCDMVYDQLFFDDLYFQIKNCLNDISCVIASDRISLEVEYMTHYFRSNLDEYKYPCVIPNIANIASKFPTWKKYGKDRGAGYFQLANMQAIKKNGGIYSDRCRGKVAHWTSDIDFRRIMSGCNNDRVLYSIETKPQYHLNHSRNIIEQK